MKKILLVLFLMFSWLFIYIQHKIVFDTRNLNVFWYTGLSQTFPNSYVNYFFKKDANPIYVWKDKIFTDFAEQCHKNKQNCLILPHQQTYSDLVWLNSIQYVGSVIDSSKTVYLFSMLDNITNLNPYWTFPYVFGELLIPINKNMHKDLDENLKNASWTSSALLWEKWIHYNCDQDKTPKIAALTWADFYKIINNKWAEWDSLKNPCSNYEIPWYLWFNYYYYLANWEKSWQSYKIASFNEDTPKVVSSMVAVVLGRLGQHVQSMGLWFSQYLAFLEKYQNSKSQDETALYETKVLESQNRSLFEFQLNVLEISSNTYGQTECPKDYKCLLQKWFIKNVLLDTAKNCQKYTSKDFEWDNLFKMAQWATDYQDKIKCFMLIYWYKSQNIKDSWELNYPFNSWDNQFEFNFDENLNDWWVRVKN